MKKIALVFSIVFIILTFIGVVYVIYTGGNANAGYAVVPMVFSLVSIAFYRNNK